MNKTLPAWILVFGGLFTACGDDSGGDAGLFGEPDPPVTTGMTAEEDEGTSSTGDGLDDGLDDSPPPPPPPPPGDSSSGGDMGSDTGGESSEGGETQGVDTFSDDELMVEVVTQSMFPQGQCDDVFVTNISAFNVTWEVTLTLPGTLDQVWNAALVSEMGTEASFSGAEHNAAIDPGEQAMFGYCVTF
ncbi:MAG: cellulose binding domain-containing protein [Myxococcota bacterium]